MGEWLFITGADHASKKGPLFFNVSTEKCCFYWDFQMSFDFIWKLRCLPPTQPKE